MATADRPLRRDAQRNRDRILVAARELFAERGLAVTLDDIARHAGLGVGTVYRRFASREELVEALFEERMHELIALTEEALQIEDPWLAFESFMERVATVQASDLGLKEVMLRVSDHGSHVTRLKAQLRPAVEVLVGRARDAGVLREDFDASDIPIIQMMVGAVAEVGGEERPELWRRYLALLLDGLRTDRTPDMCLEEPAAGIEQLDAIMCRFRPQGRPRPAGS